MRGYLFLPSLVLSMVLCAPSIGAISHAEQPAVSHIAEGQGHVIRLSDSGVAPLSLKMKKEDRMVFFLNDSSDSLITLELSFGEHATHCASSNLAINDNGAITSSQPIGPKDFATSCFHDTGTYRFTVYGLRGKPDGINGSIIIE